MARDFKTDVTVNGTAVVKATRTITASSPLTGGGDLSADRSIGIQDASTAQKGAVQLTDSAATTSSTLAATATAVKTAKDAADSAQTTANAAVPKSTVTTAGDLIIATGSAAVTRLAAGANGAALVSTGTGAAPAYSTSINGTAIPSSKTLTVTTDKLSVFAATSSSELAGVISDETGSGALVFGTTPTLTTPVITQATATPSFTSNTYTLVLGDAGKMLLASNSTTAGNVKIDTNANVAFAVGTQIHVIQTGTGQLTISATTSGTTTVLSAGATAASPKLRAQYSAATMLKTATDTWYVFGDIA